MDVLDSLRSLYEQELSALRGDAELAAYLRAHSATSNGLDR